MRKNYYVDTPKDFQVVINDLLRWAEEKKYETVVIALNGDLGAGKTTFTQELAKMLGATEIVTSPTFTIMKSYNLHRGPFDQLVHIDAYRFETEAEAEPLRLPEVFLQTKTIVCVEWPERIASIMKVDWPQEAAEKLPQGLLNIDISIIEGDKRRVVVSSNVG